jgi:hypothetical protein
LNKDYMEGGCLMKRGILLLYLMTMVIFSRCNTDGQDGQDEYRPGVFIDKNPVISPLIEPDWLIWQTDPCVIRVNNRWRIYFGCNDEGVHTQIGTASSEDGVSWVFKTDNPVLRTGPLGSWDDKEIETPWVIFDADAPENEKYKMWYAGNGSPGDNRPDFTYQIGYAFSSDGINWTKYNDPQNDAGIRYRESDPVLSIPSFWDDGTGIFSPSDLSSPSDAWTTGEPSVTLEEDGTYRLYYIGLGLDETLRNFGYRVLLAESRNGYQWIKKGVVFECDHQGNETEAIMCPAVIKRGCDYLLFYTMVDIAIEGGFAVFEQGYTGVAISKNGGMTFDRAATNPIIPHGSIGSYYNSGAFAASPVLVDGTIFLYFSGSYIEFDLFGNPLEFKPSIGRGVYNG